MLRVLFLIRVPLHNISAANRPLHATAPQRRMKSETARSVAINFRNFIYLVSSQLCLASDQQEEGELKGSQSFGVAPPSNECETDVRPSPRMQRCLITNMLTCLSMSRLIFFFFFSIHATNAGPQFLRYVNRVATVNTDIWSSSNS